MTNCANCGAVIESGLDKCPYCGTSYFDFSSIDLKDDKPTIIKFRVGKTVLEMLAYPTIGAMTLNNDPVYIRDRMGKEYYRSTFSSHISIEIGFEGIVRNDGTLIKAYTAES